MSNKAMYWALRNVPNISSAEKLVLAMICSHLDGHHLSVSLTKAELSKECDLKEDLILQVLQSLVEEKIIEIDGKVIKIIAVDEPFWEKDLNDVQKRFYYIRGILRNRLTYLNEDYVMDVITDFYNEGIELIEIERAAKRCRSWTNFKNYFSQGY